MTITQRALDNYENYYGRIKKELKKIEVSFSFILSSRVQNNELNISTFALKINRRVGIDVVVRMHKYICLYSYRKHNDANL